MENVPHTCYMRHGKRPKSMHVTCATHITGMDVVHIIMYNMHVAVLCHTSSHREPIHIKDIIIDDNLFLPHTYYK